MLKVQITETKGSIAYGGKALKTGLILEADEATLEFLEAHEDFVSFKELEVKEVKADVKTDDEAKLLKEELTKADAKITELGKELGVEKQKVEAVLQENKDLKENKEVLEKNIKGYKDSLDGKEKLVASLEAKITELEKDVKPPVVETKTEDIPNPAPDAVETPLKKEK